VAANGSLEKPRALKHPQSRYTTPADGREIPFVFQGATSIGRDLISKMERLAQPA
jgi:hypothetical protein